MKPVWPGKPGGYVPGKVAEDMIRQKQLFRTPPKQIHLQGNGKRAWDKKD